MSNATYSGADIARAHDDLQNRHETVIKGICIKVVQTPNRRGPYDRFDLVIDGALRWTGRAASIDPMQALRTE